MSTSTPSSVAAGARAVLPVVAEHGPGRVDPAQPRAIAPARPAATTLILRDGAAGLEVLMVRRSLQASFMPGSYVFPGGTVDAADTAAEAEACCDESVAAAAQRLHLAADDRAALGCLVAGLRECFEECGLLLGLTAPPDAQRLAEVREALREGRLGFVQACRQLCGHVPTQALAPWAHWVTPKASPKRFDTRFLVALAPPGQAPHIDRGETIGAEWLAPGEALARFSRGDFDMPLVTIRVLESLAEFTTAQALLAHARSGRHVETVFPQVALDREGRRHVILPADQAYAEVARLDPHGHITARSAIVPGELVQLAPCVWRLTAPNAGYMTGPGTNTYLLGRDGEYAVLDPGPVLDAHLDALMQATAGRIVAVLATHTHGDHSPAAQRLCALTGAVAIGRPAPPQAGQDATFAPQQVAADGQVFDVAGVRLQSIHTPGHASNHVCWWLEEEGMLFTGDHLMQGSTVVINPPDGDMGAYLRSLRSLPVRLPTLQWLAPGHGFLMAQPQATIERLIEHRLAREAKVVQGLRALGGADVQALLPRVYDDVDPRIFPVAARSLLAHLIKLREDGVAAEDAQGRWRYAGG